MYKPTIVERLKSIPVLFPLVAAFHVIMLVITIFNFGQAGVLNAFVPATTCLEWLAYTLLWITVSIQQRRWAVISYIILTALNLALQFLTPSGSEWREIGSTVFPFDVLLCFFLLFYYKRFR